MGQGHLCGPGCSCNVSKFEVLKSAKPLSKGNV